MDQHQSRRARTLPLEAREIAATIFSKPTAILLMLAFFGANFVSTVFIAWTPTFLVENSISLSAPPASLAPHSSSSPAQSAPPSAESSPTVSHIASSPHE